MALLEAGARELRTPMQALLASAEVIALHARDRAAVQHVQRLEDSIAQIKGRLDSIAALVQLSNRGLSGRRHSFQLRTVFEQVFAECGHAAHASDQTLKLDIVEVACVTGFGDASWLQDVLFAFASHVIWHLGPGVICLRARPVNAGAAIEFSVCEERRKGNPPAGMTTSECLPSSKAWPPQEDLGFGVLRLLAATIAWKTGLQCHGPLRMFFVIFPVTLPDRNPDPFGSHGQDPMHPG